MNASSNKSTVYVDKLQRYAVYSDAKAEAVGRRHGHLWCHMWSDDLEALHEMAAKIGMRRDWFQNKARFPHYDLVASRREAAIRYGAVECSLMDFLREKRDAESLGKTAWGRSVLETCDASTAKLMFAIAASPTERFRVDYTEDSGVEQWVITPVSDPGLWMDGLPTRAEAVELCQSMRWKLIDNP